MKKLLSIFFLFFFCLINKTLPQNPQWVIYDTTNVGCLKGYVQCIGIDNSDIKWIVTSEGLVKYDNYNWNENYYVDAGWYFFNVPTAIAIDQIGNKWIGNRATMGSDGGLYKFDNNGTWTDYSASNSLLPSNILWDIVIDNSDNKWIATHGGLARLSDTAWTVFNTANSEIPSNELWCIEIDNAGNKWVGTSMGLVKFDDTKWEIFNTANSEIPGNEVSCITVDNSNVIWIGITIDQYPNREIAIAKFDGTNWTIYDESNSGLPVNLITCIEVDEYGTIWFGSYSGLVKFDGFSWTEYKVANSDLPGDIINGIIIDKYGNKWIAFGSENDVKNGLAIFNENGVVPVELKSFTATANGKEVTLNWSTATELNNQGFEVQRKFGSNDFVTIGSVKGHGTTTSLNSYTYTDKLADAGKYFYRLKQIDYGGKYEYSEVVEVNWSPFTTYKLEQNYPNPFNPTTTIGFGIPEKANVRLSILNILGEEIRVLLNEEKESGHHSIEFNASDLPSGVYFYQLRTGSFVETKKMVLLR